MRKTVAYAFHHSIPILIGFFPVGLAYGLLMQQAGYNFLWSGACSLFVLAGSLQFLMVTFFAGGVSLATVAVLALLLNSRHIFYGLSFIDKFRSFGPWRWFLIYSLCDENYSLHCSHDFGPDVNEKWAYVLTAAFVTFYWVALSMLGGLVGSLIPFDTTGIDFALTALFTAPLYGFAAPLSSEGKRDDGGSDTMAIEVPKAQKAFVYACAIVGALGAFLGLGSLFGGGMGMPRLKSTERGDMYVHITVLIPKKVTKKQRELLEKLADEMGEEVAAPRSPGAA